MRLVPEHVLVVEDNPLLSAHLAAMLQDIGVEMVREVATVAEASAAVREKIFDLVILDLQLGNDNGLVIAEQCAAERVPVILSTGYGDVLLPVTYSTEQLLRKPYSMKDLERSISHLVARAPSSAA